MLYMGYISAAAEHSARSQPVADMLMLTAQHQHTTTVDSVVFWVRVRFILSFYFKSRGCFLIFGGKKNLYIFMSYIFKN
jgi:hypothetical protein